MKIHVADLLKHVKILIVATISCLFAACTQEPCGVVPATRVGIQFLRADGSVINDTLQEAIGSGNSSALPLARGRRGQWLLNLNPNTDSTTYTLNLRNGQPLVLRLNYQRSTYLVSERCGFAFKASGLAATTSGATLVVNEAAVDTSQRTHLVITLAR